MLWNNRLVCGGLLVASTGRRLPAVVAPILRSSQSRPSFMRVKCIEVIDGFAEMEVCPIDVLNRNGVLGTKVGTPQLCKSS